MKNFLKSTVAITVVLTSLFSASLVYGEDARPKEENTELESESSVRFIHQPRAKVNPGESLVVRGFLSPASVVEILFLAYRRGPDNKWQETVFKRGADNQVIAEVPAEHSESPGIDYYVYLQTKDEKSKPEQLFASREDPYRVVVHGYSKKSRYESRKAQWKGRLSRAELNYGYSDFGENLKLSDGSVDEYEKTDKGNYYHEVNIAYTYRFLTYLYALHVEVAGVAHDFADFKPLTGGKDEKIGPGMYTLSPSVEFEFAKYFGATVLIRLGISEEEFEGGTGMSVRVGRITSTRLDVGLEWMSHAGWRVFTRFEWDTIPYVPMSFNIERTQWYAADSYAEEAWGNRMFYEARVNLPAGLGLRGHVGFAARDESVESGIVAGGGAWVDF